MSSRTDRRTSLALLLGLAALVTALLAARGPAIAERADYTWPPANLPARAPTAGWYAPLLVAQHHAERIDARIPCGDEAVVPDAERPILVFSSVRHARERNGLSVTRARNGRTTVRVGEHVLLRLDSAADRTACAFDIHFDENAWTISRNDTVIRSGTVTAAPAVSGFFSDLDLRARPGLAVTYMPHVQDTTPSTTQSLLRALTVLLLVAAVLALVPGALSRRSFRIPRLALQDLVVLLVTCAWWLLAPLHFDDGWVRAREVNSLVSGGYSSYYEHFGANLPLATWFEWLQHFVVAHTSSLALHRLPMAVLLGFAWLVCRWCVRNLLGRAPSRADSPWWAAALTFCLGAVAFGITLRAEPAITLLVVGVLACCIQYARRPSSGVLVLAVVLTGLAVTAHPAGIIALAPLVLCLPKMWRDARSRDAVRPLELAAVLAIGLAWTGLVVFVDSDLAMRKENVELIQASGWHAQGIFDEDRRYAYLGDRGASAVRREFVAVLLLAVVALVVVHLRGRNLAERLPSASIGLGLVLLAVTPSKWIWHFGGFVGLAAVAIAVETDRLASNRVSRRKLVIVSAAVTGLAAWASLDPNEWGPLDLGRLRWYDAPVPYIAAAVGALAVVLLMARVGRLKRPDLAILPAVLAGFVGVTLFATATDAAVSGGWTAPRQALSSLVAADASCGVADDLVIPTPDSMRWLATVSRSELASSGRASISPVRSAAWEVEPITAKQPSRWYRLPLGLTGVFVSRERLPSTGLVVYWGRSRGGTIERVGAGPVDLRPAPGRDRPRDWTFVSEESFPARPEGANAIRFASRSHGAEHLDVLTITRPVSFVRTPLGGILSAGDRSAVDPFLVEATPCAELPTLAYGVGGAPQLLVEWYWGPNFAGPTSPFLGVDDVFHTFDVPVERSGHAEDRIVAHWALPDPAEALVRPMRRQWLE